MTVSISVQWHITTACNNRCKHCYMYDEATYEQERNNTLDFNGLLAVLERLREFEDKWDAVIRDVVISGGDPLLRKEWRKLLREIKRRGKRISILGNPETLTEENALWLARLGVSSFQMSLDGLEQTHDDFRSRGSFQRTVEKLGLLDRVGILSQVMFTLYPTNADQLVPLLRYVAEETTAATFGFDVGCSVGNAADMDSNFTREHMQQIFETYIEEKTRLRREGNPMRIAEKPNLLNLTRFARHDIYPVASEAVPVVSGCAAGWSGIAILSDGTALACRRMPLVAGKLPEQSFEDVFLGSELMRKLRRPESFASCGSCEFYALCRGCPANVYGVGGSAFAEPPLCFRERIGKHIPQAPKRAPSPTLDASYEEEFALLSGRFDTTLQSRLEDALDDAPLGGVFVDLVASQANRRSFLTDPHRYLQRHGYKVSDEAKVFLTYYFSATFWQLDVVQEFTPILASTMLARMMDRLFDRTDRVGRKNSPGGAPEFVMRMMEDGDFRNAFAHCTTASARRAFVSCSGCAFNRDAYELAKTWMLGDVIEPESRAGASRGAKNRLHAEHKAPRPG